MLEAIYILNIKMDKKHKALEDLPSILSTRLSRHTKLRKQKIDYEITKKRYKSTAYKSNPNAISDKSMDIPNDRLFDAKGFQDLCALIDEDYYEAYDHLSQLLKEHHSEERMLLLLVHKIRLMTDRQEVVNDEEIDFNCELFDSLFVVLLTTSNKRLAYEILTVFINLTAMSNFLTEYFLDDETISSLVLFVHRLDPLSEPFTANSLIHLVSNLMYNSKENCMLLNDKVGLVSLVSKLLSDRCVLLYIENIRNLVFNLLGNNVYLDLDCWVTRLIELLCNSKDLDELFYSVITKGNSAICRDVIVSCTTSSGSFVYEIDIYNELNILDILFKISQISSKSLSSKSLDDAKLVNFILLRLKALQRLMLEKPILRLDSKIDHITNKLLLLLGNLLAEFKSAHEFTLYKQLTENVQSSPFIGVDLLADFLNIHFKPLDPSEPLSNTIRNALFCFTNLFDHKPDISLYVRVYDLVSSLYNCYRDQDFLLEFLYMYQTCLDSNLGLTIMIQALDIVLYCLFTYRENWDIVRLCLGCVRTSLHVVHGNERVRSQIVGFLSQKNLVNVIEYITSESKDDELILFCDDILSRIKESEV